MASGDDLGFAFDTNSFLFLDSPETFSALTECQENPSLLVSENVQNEFVGFVPISTATNGEYPSSLIENSSTIEDTLPRTSNFDQEIKTQNQSFDQEDDNSKYFNPIEKLPMPSCTFRNGQRESVYRENCFLTGRQSIGLQFGQSYQQPLLSPTIPDFSKESYISTMMGNNVQEVEIPHGLTNINPLYGFQDHHIRPYLFQEKQYHHDSLLDQLKCIHEYDQMQQPQSSNMSIPTSVGDLLSADHHISLTSTIINPEYRTPMISNNHSLQKSRNYLPFTYISYQPDQITYDLQNSNSLKTTRPRGRPRKNQTYMPLISLTSTTSQNMSLVPTTQTFLPSPRHYGTQDKGKQLVTTMSSLMNPTFSNQYQNSYRNTMTPQSGVLRQRSCYDHIENERPSSKIRRIMLPIQEKSIPDSSMISFRQGGNMGSSAISHHDERSIKNTVYDPLYASVGLPMDPHLRTTSFA